MKKFLILFMLIILHSNFVFAVDEVLEQDETLIQKAKDEVMSATQKTFKISEFLNETENYTSQLFDDVDLKDVFKETISGKITIDKFKKTFFKLLGKNALESIKLMINIMLIIVVHSILKAIVENLGNDSSAQIAYFIQYLIIVTLVIKSFTNVLEITKDAIDNLSNFMNLLIPLLTTLILTTGCVSIANIVQPILIFLSSIIGNFFNNVLIPILLISITLSIVSNISSKVQLNKISKFFKSSIIWILGIVLTVFTGLLSIEGTLGSSVDGLTSKTTKAVVSNFIPIVGKVLGDATETIIGCSNILKNAVGIIGLLVIAGIVLVPIIKVLTLWFAFNLTSAVCSIVADEKIVKLTEQIADSYKIVLAILFSISAMFFISITLVLKMTNNVVM